MGKYVSWPGATRKAGPSLKKSQTLCLVAALFTLKPHWTSVKDPHFRVLTLGVSLPQWAGSFPSRCISHVVFTHRILVWKIAVFLSSASISSLVPISLFHCVYPKQCKNWDFLIYTPCFSTQAFCSVYQKRHAKTILSSFFLIPVNPEQLNSEFFYILVMLSPKACWDFSSTFWKRKRLGKVRIWEKETNKAMGLPSLHPGRGKPFKSHL